MQLFKVLVVEDVEGFCQLICSLLKSRADFLLEVASDGLVAVRKAEALQPDLILLDISLRKHNGMELARRVRKLVPSARIIFFSVESDTDLVREALTLGAGYIHKGRVQSDLLSAIEVVLRGEQFVSGDLGPSKPTNTLRRHEVLFYSDDLVLLESFARSIAAALETGNAAIVVATKSRLKNLVQRLKAEGFDVDGATQQGTYISLDAVEMLLTIMASGVPDVVQFCERLCRAIASAAQATKREHPRITICNECVGLLCALGNKEAAIRLEKVCNFLVQERNVDILCGYPSSSFDGSEENRSQKRICSEHTFIYSR